MTDEIKALNLNNDEEAAASPQEPSQALKPAKPKKPMMVMISVLILLGIGSGYGLYALKKTKTAKKLETEVSGELTPGDTFGVMDEKAFRDIAEGEMAAGGIKDEGSHHLIREGGESKYVYLTSSMIDLDQFVGKNVKVWGETFGAQEAGWLMDVGRLQIL